MRMTQRGKAMRSETVQLAPCVSRALHRACPMPGIWSYSRAVCWSALPDLAASCSWSLDESDDGERHSFENEKGKHCLHLAE